MTQITLTIVGSASTLARVLAALDGPGDITRGPDATATAIIPQIGDTITADIDGVRYTGSVVAPSTEPAAAPLANSIVNGEAVYVPAEHDATGLPWDARIHAATKTKTSAGKWTKRKGLAEGVYEAVEAELRASNPLSAAPAAATVEPAPMVFATPVATTAPEPQPVMPVMQPVPVPVPLAPYNPVPPVEQPMPVPVPVMPVMQPVPVPVPQPVQPVAQVGGSFHDLMQLVGAKMQSGEMTTDYLIATQNEINAGLNLAMQSFTDMADKPHAVQYCYQIFQRDGKM